MSCFRRSLPWLLVALVGCFQMTSGGDAVSGDQQGCRSNCGHGTTVGGRPAGSSGGSGSASSGGSTGAASGTSTSEAAGSSGGGSSGGSYVSVETFCLGAAAPPATASCATNTPFASQLVDVLSCDPVAGASVGAVGANGVPVSGAAVTSQSDGTFAVCLPTGNPFSIEVTAASYPTTYYAELLNADIGVFTQMGTLSSDVLSALAAFIPGGLQSSKGMILVKVTGSVCNGEVGGWSFTASLADGGAIADGGYQTVYVAGAQGFDIDPQATATASAGLGLLYNFDPSVGDFVVVTAQNPDAGACVPLNPDAGFTGRVYVAGGSTSVLPLLLP